MKDPARRSYGAIVTTTDYYVGQLIDKIEEHKLRENTIIIFMSDNGHSEESSNRIRVDNHKVGIQKDAFTEPTAEAQLENGLAVKETF